MNLKSTPESDFLLKRSEIEKLASYYRDQKYQVMSNFRFSNDIPEDYYTIGIKNIFFDLIVINIENKEITVFEFKIPTDNLEKLNQYKIEIALKKERAKNLFGNNIKFKLVVVNKQQEKKFRYDIINIELPYFIQKSTDYEFLKKLIKIKEFNRIEEYDIYTSEITRNQDLIISGYAIFSLVILQDDEFFIGEGIANDFYLDFNLVFHIEKGTLNAKRSNIKIDLAEFTF